MTKDWGKLIVALDLDRKEKIIEVVESLGPKGAKFKIGSIAFTRFGPDFLKELIDKGLDVFLDLKLHDIPNTMAKTAAVISSLGCWAFTVHLSAGKAALEAVKKEAIEVSKKLGKRAPLILGVTVLTSSDLILEERKKEVKRLGSLACNVGLGGVVASSFDVEMIKKDYKEIKVVVPGIRSPKDKDDDQIRVATAKEAFSKGADFIVVGRPIIEKSNYLKAAEDILE